VNGYLGLWFACLLLLAALFMQISGVSLALTWPGRLCLLRVLLCGSGCYELSPFQALGEVTLYPLSQASMFVYLQFMWEVGLPPSPVEFSFLHHSHKISCSWLLGMRRLSRPLQLAGMFIYSSRRDSPPPLFSAQGTPPCYPCVFIVLIAYYSVSLFFPGWGSVCPGGYADLSQVVCGCTTYHLAHRVVCIFPSCLGAVVWWPGGPPGFSIHGEVEMLCTGRRYGGVKVLPLLGGFACKVCLWHLSKISL
jgi:hypothetical protein